MSSFQKDFPGTVSIDPNVRKNTSIEEVNLGTVFSIHVDLAGIIAPQIMLFTV